uniref:Uncharacterized protein n=1 Tax=Anguilla anguilla TaxID=7936 RepID=A0A0E9S743_ANGAN
MPACSLSAMCTSKAITFKTIRLVSG